MEIIKGEFIKFGEQLDMFDLIDKNFKEEPNGETIEMEIVSYKEFENLQLTHKQIKIIINALKVYEKCVADSKMHDFDKNYKIEEAESTIKFLEEIINYNYDKALNKCINKYTNKKSKEDEEGMETFAWLNKKSQKGEENDTTTDNK